MADGSRSTAASGCSLFACWAMMRFNITVLFVAMGVYAIIAALITPSPFRKPYVDQTLE